jgi:hypothetical protein
LVARRDAGHHAADAAGHDGERLALNIDQVRKYNPPENPAKQTDSRCEGYIREFGSPAGSWTRWSRGVLANLVPQGA